MAELISNRSREFDGDDPWWAIAAKQPKPPGPLPEETATETPDARPEEHSEPTVPCHDGRLADQFVPLAPRSLAEARIGHSQVEALILKLLSNRATATGKEVAEQIKLPFGLMQEALRRMKEERLVVYKAAAPMSDYVHELTELGFERARRYSEQCTYFGAAPVSLDQYVNSVHAQSIRKLRASLADLRMAFSDLVLGEGILSQLGQAISSGLGLFLYGSSGNGKSSIAERVTDAFGEGIWIPRAISALGEIIRLYDPSNHVALSWQAPDATLTEDEIDRRWIFIRRPTIVVGGELTMDNLEITTNRATGLGEAPLQMKSNGGTLVIDDFGRQRMRPSELLNRWIVPLEKRYDFLNLASGRKIQVPFDQLIIFSTNLEPRDLVDEAFLRRIPYKIDVCDPSEQEFRDLFRQLANSMGIQYDAKVLDYLVQSHYTATGRSLRFCHPRDLLHQVRVYCDFLDRPAAITREAIDAAAKNYFAMM
ncbi:MAG: AAA family ATPase [Planctomycetes bacterium RBG_13_63_9]|nr:MAG: AAA family ATPase [Planctomycetes bacterium RBG_13_63_9]